MLDYRLTSISVSTSGFGEGWYRRIYQSARYGKVRIGVLALSEADARRSGLAVGPQELNKPYSEGAIYRDLELYRTAEGRKRAAVTRLCARGIEVRRVPGPRDAFGGG